jgi:serine/threonine protein kinase
MEFVDGYDLQEVLDRVGKPLPEKQSVKWILQVCDALTYLHSQSPPIIHRDIKPSNIRITPQGDAMLVDFGIAKFYDPVLKTTLGARAVTPGYSPQEQYGQGTTDARTDIYALGATLYTILTGEEPVESVQRSLGKRMRAPRSIVPSISAGIEKAIAKAMAMLPQNRFQSVDRFRSVLETSLFQVKISSPHKPPKKNGYAKKQVQHSVKSKGNTYTWMIGGALLLFVFPFLLYFIITIIHPFSQSEAAIQIKTPISTIALDSPIIEDVTTATFEVTDVAIFLSETHSTSFVTNTPIPPTAITRLSITPSAPTITPFSGNPKPTDEKNGIATFSIIAVTRDVSVTIRTNNFPANTTVLVRMGEMGTRGIDGIMIVNHTTGEGGSFTETYKIPSELHGRYQIVIRLETPGGTYAYNWFYNSGL